MLRAQEGALRQGGAGAGSLGQALEVAGGLVAEVAHDAAVKARQVRRRGGRVLGDLAQGFERARAVEVEGLGPEADEGVAGQPLAALDAFEQEARLSRRAENGVGADRRQEVGQDLALEGDQPVLFRKRPRVSPGGGAAAHLTSSGSLAGISRPGRGG